MQKPIEPEPKFLKPDITGIPLYKWFPCAVKHRTSKESIILGRYILSVPEGASPCSVRFAERLLLDECDYSAQVAVRHRDILSADHIRTRIRSLIVMAANDPDRDFSKESQAEID